MYRNVQFLYKLYKLYKNIKKPFKINALSRQGLVVAQLYITV